MVTSQGDDNMATSTQELKAPKIDEPSEGARVENQVRFKGAGVPGATVQITKVEDQHLVLTTLVLADGTWAGTANENLEGLITVSAFQTLNQNTSPASPHRKFTVK
ncbi:hypothetical protein C1Y11_16785 [Pseudomonas sp. FW305-20]|nr:hypothetical protein PFAS1_05185 [Pseudomonas frederiksbergensis]PMU09438.1 hypothetical protein C1Y11_16785 [Pseudomonas sp. FW305-20]PMU18649.1 hypothetical protein C1Y10_12220 [Pseudomonas sp. FW305-122]PMU40961.1 hypothetical protein C1Y12_09405 [Pseudomonas sp. FW305-47B]PMX61364.1 hypothetical protein C1Y13_12265 [Pseudomonas sp. FW305-33]PMX68999.1 hypothetical protein C1X12_09520 [Pseudomonas sp. FW305-60]